MICERWLCELFEMSDPLDSYSSHASVVFYPAELKQSYFADTWKGGGGKGLKEVTQLYHNWRDFKAFRVGCIESLVSAILAVKKKSNETKVATM